MHEETELFNYRVTKDQKVLIYWDNRLVMTLANEKARKFLRQIDDADAVHHGALHRQLQTR